MKTDEQWLDEIGGMQMTKAEHLSFIRNIQRDAFRSGMKRSAGIVRDAAFARKDFGCELIAIEKSILSECDSLKLE